MRNGLRVCCAMVTVGVAATTTPSRANEMAETACHEQLGTAAINVCLTKVYSDLDRALNAAYKAGFKHIDAASLQPSLAKDWRRAYQDTQRKWIAYREADCGPPVSYEWTGGSATGGQQLGCKIARTRERLAALKRRYTKSE